MSEETITITKKEYEELKKTNEELIQKNKYLWEQIRLGKRNRFGKSSEQTKRILPDPEQQSLLFNEIEQEADRKEQEESETETETITIKEHTRRKMSLPNLEDLPENVKVIGRKNFLFANTPKGAYSSAVIFSIIETAKENGLDPYRYLVWVLKTAPTLKMNNPQQVDLLLPANAPSHCLAGK